MAPPPPAPSTGASTGALPPGRASLTALGGVLGAVALMLLLVTWAATIGPQEVVRGEGNPPSYDPQTPSSPTASPSVPPGQARPAGGGDQDILFTAVTLVAVLLAVIVMMAVLLYVVRWLLVRDWHRSPGEPDPEEVVFDPLDAPALVTAAVVADAGSQRELLLTGSPRNAIVMCWHRFEEQAGSVGVRRQPSETSSEFTLRVLDRLAADSAAVTALAELYRDARHSAHEVTEDNRTRALEALDTIHRSLGVTAGAR